MPTARRTAVRNAFAAAITGLATTGDRVFVSRSSARPLAGAELPGLLVYSGEQLPAVSLVRNGQPVAWSWKLRADILVKDGQDAEAKADQILEEITAALFASPATMTLGGQVSSLVLVGVDETDLDDSLEKPAVRIPLVFEAIYS